MVSHKLLGQLLVERGLLPEDDLQKALSLQRERKGRLGKILLDLGYISQEDLQSVLSEQLGIPRVDAAELQEIPMEAATLPSTFLRQSLLYPYRVDDGTVFIGMADPLDSDNIRAIEQLMGRKVEVRLASEAAILKAWMSGWARNNLKRASRRRTPASHFERRRLRRPTLTNCATWLRKRR